MPIPPGTECQTSTEDALAVALSGLASVQTWLDAVDSSAALLRIHVDALPDPVNRETYDESQDEYSDLFPSALIYLDDTDGYMVERAASPWHYIPSGRMHVRFDRILTAEEMADLPSTWRTLKNLQGAIIRELLEARPEALEIDKIEAGDMKGARDDDQEEGINRACFTMALEWGLG